MNTPSGPDGFEASREEESLKAFKAWQFEQVRRKSLVDKACATEPRKGAKKKKGKTTS